jgi:hypothetical protein
MSQQAIAVENELDQKVLRVYEQLKELSVDPAAPPCVVFNAQRALAAIWQIVNDLDLVHEELFEYGI